MSKQMECFLCDKVKERLEGIRIKIAVEEIWKERLRFVCEDCVYCLLKNRKIRRGDRA